MPPFVIYIVLDYINIIMACKCKETAKNAAKYTDEETLINPEGVDKAAAVLSKIFLVIFVGIVLIIAVPFIVVIATICVITGKSFNISKLLKIFTNGKHK